MLPEAGSNGARYPVPQKQGSLVLGTQEQDTVMLGTQEPRTVVLSIPETKNVVLGTPVYSFSIYTGCMIEEYLAKWLELSKTSTGNFNALVDLIVKEQFTKACPDESAVYLLLERGP